MLCSDVVERGEDGVTFCRLTNAEMCRATDSLRRRLSDAGVQSPLAALIAMMMIIMIIMMMMMMMMMIAVYARQVYSPASDCCAHSMNRRAFVEPSSSGRTCSWSASLLVDL